MKFAIRIHFDQCVEQKTVIGRRAPRDYFARAVQLAVNNGTTCVELLRIMANGSETIIDCWERCDAIAPARTDMPLDEQIEVKFGYKIHGFSTTANPAKSANTLKWYRTEADAIKHATKMAQSPGNKEALVIYKAIKIVTAVPVDVLVTDLD